MPGLLHHHVVGKFLINANFDKASGHCSAMPVPIHVMPVSSLGFLLLIINFNCMKKNSTPVLLVIIANFITIVAFSQGIGINATSAAPDSSAMLDVQSTAKGMLIPRMTSAQRNAIALPATGLMVFDKTTKSFWFKSTSRWVELVDSTNTIWAKKDTSVYLNDNQNVGIGTSAPEVRLHIERGTDVGAASGGYLQLGATSNPNLAFDNNEIQARNNGRPANLTMQLGGGNTGIGTSNPEVKLQISNGTDIGLYGGGYLQLGAGTVPNLGFDNNQIQARNNASPSTLYLQHNGGNLQLGANDIAASTTNVYINNGKLLKPETGSANLLPLCYGKVSANGTLISGTSNVSVVKGSRTGQYVIHCSGLTSSTIMTGCTNDIGGGSSLNVQYNATDQALATIFTGAGLENMTFSFIFYNL
jgi:hypothetical protein